MSRVKLSTSGLVLSGKTLKERLVAVGKHVDPTGEGLSGNDFSVVILKRTGQELHPRQLNRWRNLNDPAEPSIEEVRIIALAGGVSPAWLAWGLDDTGGDTEAEGDAPRPRASRKRG